MALNPGDRLGPYEILARIGAGGMGEVYRARDTRLGREVAIKTSKEQFTERFEREGRAVAALNHPNIAQLYDIGALPNGAGYLVMEYVEGTEPKGPLPVDDVLTLTAQIADALDAAHEKGITHRDLKPANIKIKPDGTVKILDFGLAKLGQDTTRAAVTSENSPTLTMHATDAGMILGTAGYMSPEQARGKHVDRRTDVWAFGVVVYELLTGKKLFTGEDVVDILAAIVKSEPDVSAAPAQFHKLLHACLQKDPKRRLQAAGDWKLLLTDEADPPGGAGLQPAAGLQPGQSRFGKIAIAAAAVFAVATVALGIISYRHVSEEPPQVTKLSLAAPDKANFSVRGAIPQISPDGRRIVFAPRIDEKTDLWVRDLDSLSARMLSGTSGATYPFWSPDSRWVGFFADNKLKRIDVTGGPPLTVCDAAGGRGGTWSQNGVIVFATYSDGLRRVAAAGGTSTLIRSGGPSVTGGPGVIRYPWFLPDGRHFLYSTVGAVSVQSVDAGLGPDTLKEVLKVNSNAVYAPPTGSSPGYLLYLRDRTLMAQLFDASKLELAGDPVPVAEQVAFVSPPAAGQFSAARNGTLVYAPEVPQNKQLTWFDRNGKSVGFVGTPADTRSVAISPDGSTVAADPRDPYGTHDIWLHDLVRGTSSRLTFRPGAIGLPVWSPDGRRIGFAASYNVPLVRNATGAGEDGPIGKDHSTIADWSHDGQWLIQSRNDPKTFLDVWASPLYGEKKPFAYLNGEYNEQNAKLSPNGQWLAYASDESKRFEVYVQTFPEHGGKWQISTDGGDYPVWSRDGHELYFIGADRKLRVVEIKGDGKNFTPSVPRPLFELAAQAPFDVSKDGRFLIQLPVEQDTTNVLLTVITNWQAGLKK